MRERTQSSQDITAAVVSVEERLKDARTERRSLLRQLAKATTPNQTTSIRERLRLVSGQIAAAKRDLRRVKTRASYSSIAVTLLADRRSASGADDDDSAGWTPGDALDDAVRILEVSAGVLLVAGALAAPARARRPAGVARRAPGRPAAPRARARRCVAWRGMPPPPEDTAELLSRIPVFAELGPEDLGRVAQVAVQRAFEAQEVIFREGDDSDTCYVVRSGHACAIRQHSDGRMITLARFGPGDIFGELAMFDDERRSATVEALDALATVAIPGSAMRNVLRRHPEIAVKLVIALGRRLRAANERLARQSFQTVQSRVAAVLDQLVEQARAEGEARRPRRARHGDAGRARAARGLLARVGQPLPRRARARGGHQPGPRAPHRPRPRGAARLCLLSASSPSAASSCGAATCS